MAITKSTPVITTADPGVSLNAAMPPYVAGNVWIAIVQARAVNAFGDVAGWTRIADQRASTSSSGTRVVVFCRVPNGTEPSTITFPMSGSSSPSLAIVYAMSGVDTASILDGDVSQDNAGTIADTDLHNEGIITTYDGTFLFNIQAGNGGSTTDLVFGHQAGWTSDLDYKFSYDDININYKTQATAGDSGSVNGTVSVATRWVTVVFGLKDSGAIAVNQPPAVNVGADKFVDVGTNVALTASYTDPENQAVTFLWEKVSGPTEGTIADPTAQSTSVSGLAVGTYVFRCTVTDSESAATSDDLTVTVSQSTDYPTVYVLVNGTWERRRLYTRRNGVWV